MREIDVKKLFELAVDQVIGLEEALFKFRQLLRDDYELSFFFENPLVPKEDKRHRLSGLVPEAPAIFNELVNLLIDEGLEKSVAALSEKLTKLVSERTGTVFVDVTTPFPLREEDLQQIRRVLGGKPHLRVTLDKKLIGGIRLLASDGRYFDGSLAGAIEELKEEMINA